MISVLDAVTFEHVLQGLCIASACLYFFAARHAQREKDLLIEQNATMRLALREAADELYLASALFSHEQKMYYAKCAFTASEAARKAGAS